VAEITTRSYHSRTEVEPSRLREMGPNNPWSPSWRPDPSGSRLASIRIAKRGAVLASIGYIAVGAAIVLLGTAPRTLTAAALAVGLPGVALLGAGLAPAAIGSAVDGLVVGVAMAIGAPVAAVTSLVIGAFIIDAAASSDFSGLILRASMSAAIGAAPLVAIVSALWVLGIRRLHRAPVPLDGPSDRPPTDGPTD
jgi:hypothetical protein